MSHECYDKPIWTIRALRVALPGLPARLVRIAATPFAGPISGQLRERIMLAVTGENRCTYCRMAHTALARSEGLGREEIRQILAGDDSVQDAAAVAALAYVRDLARRGFTSRDDRLWAALGSHYSEAQRQAIDDAAHVINLSNRFGNTFDAARARLMGRCEDTAATRLDLAILSPLFAAGTALLSPVIGALLVIQWARRSRRSHLG